MTTRIWDGVKYNGMLATLVNGGIVCKHNLHFVTYKINYLPEEENKFHVNNLSYNMKCLGNYCETNNGCKNHYGCGIDDICFRVTSKTKGPCVCPYKEACHIPRQMVQVEFLQKGYNKSIEECDFYQMFIKEQKEVK